MSTLPADKTAIRRPTQFSLRTILLLTTAVAALFAARPWLQIAEFAMVAILLVALANHLGLFGLIQGRYIAQSALYVAAAAFLASMFLPFFSDDGFEMKGWEIAWIVISEFFDGREGQPVPYIIFWLTVRILFVIATLAMVACPILAHRLAVGKALWLRTLLSIVALSPWCVLFDVPSLTVMATGYYLWAISMSIPLLVLPTSRRHLAVMVVAASWLVVWAKYLPSPPYP